MLKVVAYILGLLLLSQTVFYCDDNMSLELSNQTMISAQDNHSSHGDCCTPFCICNCCHTLVVNTAIDQVLPSDVIRYYVDDLYPFYSSVLIPNIVLDIWQPPQLA